MSAVLSSIKRVVESVAGSGPAVRIGLARRRGQRLILSYHNVVASDAAPALGDRSLHLPAQRFREQLDAIAESGLPVVALDEEERSRRAGASVVITFDDAYAGALTIAVPELARRRLQATIFVAPKLLGQSAPWWDRLADSRQGAVPEAIRDCVLTEGRGEGELAAAMAAAHGWKWGAIDPVHRIGDEGDLQRALAEHPGLQLGNHTWSHPNLAALAALEPAAVEEQLRQTSRWLESRFPGRVIPYLAYPYGLESVVARQIVANIGLRGALRVTGGWDTGAGDRYGIARLNITPGLTIAGFRSRVAGWLR